MIIFVSFGSIVTTKLLGCSNCHFDAYDLQPLSMFCTPIYKQKDFKGVTFTDK